jgi:hypothetical protein
MWANDFAMSPNEFSDRMVAELKFTWAVDEFNSLYIGLHNESDAQYFQPTSQHGAASAIGVSNAWAGLNRAWFTTDLAKAFKLPVGVVAKMGFEEWKNKDFTKVFVREYEDIVGKGYKLWGGQVEIVPSAQFTLRGNWSWDPNDLAAMVGGYGVVGPVAYEAAYYSHSGMSGAGGTLNGDGDLGLIEAGFLFKQDVAEGLNLAVPVALNYDLDKADTETVPAYDIRGGARLNYKGMFAGGFVLASKEESELNSAIVELWAKPVADKPLELIAIIGLGIDDAIYAEMLDSAEVTLKYMIGKSAWWLGLLWNADGGQNLAKKLADFNIGGATGTAAVEHTAVFMRGQVTF